MTDAIAAIDFGTSNSLLGARVDGQRLEALPLDPAAADPTLLRTLLYFKSQNACFYGHEAIAKYLEFEMEGRLFRSFKTHLPNRNYLGSFVEDRPVTLESMVGIFLLEMKKRAEAHLETSLDYAVMGRPARYSLESTADTLALHRMQKACDFAGFKKVEFVPEPLAAALDLRRNLREEKIALVGDFGGGTSDFTLIRLGPYDFHKDHVLGLEGCPLAGDALDSLFMSERLNAFFGAKAQYRVLFGSNTLQMPASIMERLNRPAHIVHLSEKSTYEFIREVRKGALSSADRDAMDRLFVLIEDQQIFSFFEQIECSKRALSKNPSCAFRFDYPGIEITSEFSQTDFTAWATETKQKIFSALDRCLAQAGLSESQIDLVCLTGGSGQVPLIREELVRRFGAEKLQTQSHFHSVLSGLLEAPTSFY